MSIESTIADTCREIQGEKDLFKGVNHAKDIFRDIDHVEFYEASPRDDFRCMMPEWGVMVQSPNRDEVGKTAERIAPLFEVKLNTRVVVQKRTYDYWKPGWPAENTGRFFKRILFPDFEEEYKARKKAFREMNVRCLRCDGDFEDIGWGKIECPCRTIPIDDCARPDESDLEPIVE